MQIIAFTGRKGHGKDSAAAPILEIRHPKSVLKVWTQVNFSDAVKQICMRAFGLTTEEVYDPLVKGVKLTAYPYETPRSIMQRVGTDLFRKEWPNVWVEAWEREAIRHPHVVVTDLRFLNEFNMIKRRWGVVIRVKRPGMNDSDEHQSETETESFDADSTIMNDGSLEDLEKKVLEIPVVKETIE